VPAPTCPACQGEQLWLHPGGWLSIDHTNACPLRAFEDSLALADRDRCRTNFTRPATDTERALLSALGLALPAVLDTHVRYLSVGVRSRTWPTLHPQLVAASRDASAGRAAS
jgi:hypothetical protein